MRGQVSVDSRFDENHDKFLVQWLTEPSDPNRLLSQTLRYHIENDVRGEKRGVWGGGLFRTKVAQILDR